MWWYCCSRFIFSPYIYGRFPPLGITIGRFRWIFVSSCFWYDNGQACWSLYVCNVLPATCLFLTLSWYQIVQPSEKTFTCAEAGVCENRFWWPSLRYRYSLAKLLSSVLPSMYVSWPFNWKHETDLNTVPSLPDVMPHTEPPDAYAHIDPLRIKFLERQELRSQRWVSSNISPSIQSMGSQSAYGSSPETLHSSNASVCSSQITLGSPSLLPGPSYTMTKENFPPTYTLRNPEGMYVIRRQLICYSADPTNSRL